MGQYSLRSTPRMPFDEIPAFAMRNALALTAMTTLKEIKPPFPWKWHERQGCIPPACHNPTAVKNRLEVAQLFILLTARLQINELRPWGDPIAQALVTAYIEARTYQNSRDTVDPCLIAEIATWDLSLTVGVVVDAYRDASDNLKYYHELDERLAAAEAAINSNEQADE